MPKGTNSSITLLAFTALLVKNSTIEYNIVRIKNLKKLILRILLIDCNDMPAKKANP